MNPTLKPGDRVEILVRGKVTDVDAGGCVYVALDGCSIATGFSLSELAAAKITILEPELKVGRAVTLSGNTGRVLALHGANAWFAHDSAPDEPCTFTAANLRNIPEDQP